MTLYYNELYQRKWVSVSVILTEKSFHGESGKLQALFDP